MLIYVSQRECASVQTHTHTHIRSEYLSMLNRSIESYTETSAAQRRQRQTDDNHDDDVIL